MPVSMPKLARTAAPLLDDPGPLSLRHIWVQVQRATHRASSTVEFEMSPITVSLPSLLNSLPELLQLQCVYSEWRVQGLSGDATA